MDEQQETETECWRGFWEIVGSEAYRIWREDQAPPAPLHEAA
ncbi:hypothetical protein [Streptomyces agglomeratus]|nr:hypothetical protein [Streptomyces agglomeratus]